MKLIHHLLEKIRHVWEHSSFVSLLALLFAIVPSYAQACGTGGPPPARAQAEKPAEADVIFSGKILAADKTNFPFLDLKLEVVNMVKGRADRVVMARTFSQIPCGEGFDYLKAGQWWTFHLHQDEAKGALFIGNVEPFCEKNARPTPGGSPGTCSKVLAQAVELDRVKIDAGSTVSVGPERSVAAIEFARLQGRSSFAGVALPRGTAWFARLKEFDLPDRLAIGPANMKGRVMLIYVPGSGSLPGAFYASPSPGHGELTLYGVPVEEVRFTAPGWIVDKARLSTPGVMRGIYIEDYVTFTPDGKFATFRSARDQVVNGMQIKKCDSVDLVVGQMGTGRFFNACAGR